MIVFRLLGLLWDVLFLPLRLLQQRTRPGTWLSITIEGSLVDVVGKPRFWQLQRQKSTSLHALSEAVTRMVLDPGVKGLLVTIKAMGGGMAAATSLREILRRAKSGGKEVAVHLPLGGDSKEVYVATAASRVFVGPTAQLSPLGFRSATRYVKSALDKVGVEPQVFACGEFKSAGETFVRDDMSEEQRLQLTRLLGSFHEELVSAIGQRGVDGRAVIDNGPYYGEEAVKAGLADDVAYEDEIKSKLGMDRDAIDAIRYLAKKQRGLFRRVRRRPVIRVIPIHGAIGQSSGAGAFGGLSMGERVVRSVRQARLDRRVKGVIVHVDSPGGSALTSDLMHHEIERLAKEKPVVVCMANVAASGGYYVAAPGACIVAQPTTITGSIGVVAARLSLDPLMERLGIKTEVVEQGARASLMSPMGRLTDDDRATIMRELEATYRTFVGVVAKGRSRPADEIEKLARGRVYTGKDAHEVGLVDVLGGFDVALEEVKKRLPGATAKRAVVELARPPREAVRTLDPPKAATLLAELLPARERILLDLQNERVLALSPIVET